MLLHDILCPWHREAIQEESIQNCNGRLFKVSKLPDKIFLDEVPHRDYVEPRLHAMYFSPYFKATLPMLVRSDYVVRILMEYYCKYHPVKKKKHISHLLKRRVWATHVGEDVGRTMCFCCKMTPITMLTFNCGHIVSEAKGGATCVENLLPICQHCNSSMGTMDMRVFMNLNQ
jgi:hypothetical protein